MASHVRTMQGKQEVRLRKSQVVPYAAAIKGPSAERDTSTKARMALEM